jgi:hypothetical protein
MLGSPNGCQIEIVQYALQHNALLRLDVRLKVAVECVATGPDGGLFAPDPAGQALDFP